MQQRELGTARVGRIIATFVIALAAVCVARILEFKWLGDVPHVMDEVVYDLQARTYALGKLTLPVAFPRGAFNYWFVDDRTARFGVFPPGWPLFLTVGHWLGVATWVNPLLHGLTVGVVARIAQRLYGARVSLLAATLYAFCPQALILAASRMSHTLVAFLTALAMLAVLVELGRRRRPVWQLIGSLAVGLAFLARPFCGFVVVLVVGGVLLWRIRSRELDVASVFRWASPALLCLIAIGLYDRALTGSMFRMPMTAYFDEHVAPITGSIFRYGPGCNSLGIGPTHGCEDLSPSHGHDLRHVGYVVGHNLSSWVRLAAVSGLSVIAAVAALVRGRSRPLALLLALPLPVLVIGYALYWNVGTSYGARFYHAALPGFVVVACGVASIRILRRRAMLIGVGGIALAWSVFALGRAGAELSESYWGVDRRFADLAERWDGPPAMVMVAFRTPMLPLRADQLSWTGIDNAFGWSNGIRIGGAFAQNSPMLDGRLVFAKFHVAFVPELRRRFPGRVLLMYLMADDRRNDQLVPYDGAKISGLTDEPPPNFDGVILR